MGVEANAAGLAKKMPDIAREIQRNRMGRGDVPLTGREIPGPTQNVNGARETALARPGANPHLLRANV